jgi:multiple sugar transport system permease protein
MARAERWVPYLFLMPVIILLLVFRYIPIAAGLLESVYVGALDLTTGREFVGLYNFQRLWEDPVFWRSLRVTLIFSLIVNPLQTFLALALAELANQRVRGIGGFRALFLLPVAISMNVTAIAWGLALDQNYGLVNGILASLNLPRQPFLNSPDQALASIIGIISWVGVPYWMLFFLAGLQGISKEVLESAAIDGANAFRTFFYIKLPLLKRVIAFVLVTDTVVNFTLFAPVYLLTRGGPQLSTHLVMYEVWRRGLVYGDLGLANAMTIALLFIVVIFIIFEFISLRPQH